MGSNFSKDIEGTNHKEKISELDFKVRTYVHQKTSFWEQKEQHRLGEILAVYTRQDAKHVKNSP